MTVSASALRADSTGNGVGLNHPYDWKINAKEELKVIKVTIATLAEEELTVDSDYTVTGVGADGGGNVVIDPALSALYKLVIIPNLDYKQDADFTNQNSVPPEEVESALDKISRQIKQIAEVLTRTVTVSAGNTGGVDDYLADVQAERVLAETARTGAETAETDAETAKSGAETARDEVVAIKASMQWGSGIVTVTNADSPITAVMGRLYLVDTSGGAVIINLPAISSDGTIGAQKTTPDANTITINRNGTDTISGGTSSTEISNNGEQRTLSADNEVSPKNWAMGISGTTGGNFTVDEFDAGVDFTAGSSTTITLSSAPGSKNNVDINFDGYPQQKSEYEVSGVTVTFDEAIPTGTTKIEAKIGRSSEINVPGDLTVSFGKIATNAIASQAEAEAGTATNKLMTPERVKQAIDALTPTPSIPLISWAHLSLSGGVATLNASSNVASLVRNGTGDFTLTWDTDYDSAFYAVSGMANYVTSIGNDEGSVSIISLAAGSARFQATDTHNTNDNTDYTEITIMAIGVSA